MFRSVKFDCLQFLIAESVWLFNHRHDNIYLLLLSEFNKPHLQLFGHEPKYLSFDVFLNKTHQC